MNTKSTNSRKRKMVWAALVALFLIFLGIQFIRPEVQNPVVTGDFEAPMRVKAIIKNACYDCHSNETNLRWYNKIIPVMGSCQSDQRKGYAFKELYFRSSGNRSFRKGFKSA